MSLGSMEQRTAGMKRQAQELIEQAYQRGFNAGYSKAENDYHAKTEDDRQASYELGLNMAWEAARKIGQNSQSGLEYQIGFDFSKMKSYESANPSWWVVMNYSASEAIERIRAYEEQKKQEEDEEIKVGDEVVLNANPSLDENTKAIVIANEGNVMFPYNVMFDNGETDWVDRDDISGKTGRTFPEIVEVLKKMREGE